MSKRRTKKESIENLRRVINNNTGTVNTVGSMDIVMADAYEDSVVNDNHLKEVKDELDKKSEVVKTEDPSTGKDVNNEFTAKIVLDEMIENFSLTEDESENVDSRKDGRSNKIYDNDDEDDYLDYDMFDFIYGLVTDCWPKPKNPLNHRIRKFMYVGSDDYMKTNSYTGISQVATSGDTVEIYSNKAEDFNDIKEICDMYNFKYDGPNMKRSSSSHWNFSFNIHVPCESSGYPMMVEDYFEDIGKKLEDVMPADFCKQYRKRQAKIDAEVDKRLAEREIERMVNKAIMMAARDQDPLINHLEKLYKDLNAAGLTYQKSKIKAAFLSAFDD